jgi:hypothetical protein
MRLRVGDKIYSKRNGDKLVSNNITPDKPYEVVWIRAKTRYWIRAKTRYNEDDICIKDDGGSDWWFGQIGCETECWTNWFISEKEWLRNKKLEELGI